MHNGHECTNKEKKRNLCQMWWSTYNKLYPSSNVYTKPKKQDKAYLPKTKPPLTNTPKDSTKILKIF